MSAGDATDAVERYHGLLDRGDLRHSTVDALVAAHARPSWQVGERCVSTVLRPLFLSWRRYRELQRAALAVAAALRRVRDRVLRDPSLRSLVGLSPDEEELVTLLAGRTPDADVSGRFDGFGGADGALQFLEYNADSPALLGYSMQVADELDRLPILAELRRHHDVHFLQGHRDLFASLIASYASWGGAGRPVIAIVDWADVSSRRELELWAEYLGRRGCPARVVTPSELELRHGRLYANGVAVDLVYRRALVVELTSRLDRDHPLLQAARGGHVAIANGMLTCVTNHKSLLAILTDPAHAAMFSADELDAIRTHLPWTRRVVDGPLEVDGRRVDLVRYLEDHQPTLVLKPSAEYGAAGVVLGAEVTADVWRTAISRGLAGTYVAQRHVSAAVEDFPFVSAGGGITLEPRRYDLDPFVGNLATAQGAVARLTSQSLVSITGGGGSLAVIAVVGDRGR